MLTFQDLQEVEKVVREVVKEGTKHLPTNEEFSQMKNTIIGRFDKIDKNVAALTSLSQDHSDRIEKLEDIHPQGKHPQFAS